MYAIVYFVKGLTLLSTLFSIAYLLTIDRKITSSEVRKFSDLGLKIIGHFLFLRDGFRIRVPISFSYVNGYCRSIVVHRGRL